MDLIPANQLFFQWLAVLSSAVTDSRRIVGRSQARRTSWHERTELQGEECEAFLSRRFGSRLDLRFCPGREADGCGRRRERRRASISVHLRRLSRSRRPRRGTRARYRRATRNPETLRPCACEGDSGRRCGHRNAGISQQAPRSRRMRGIVQHQAAWPVRQECADERFLFFMRVVAVAEHQVDALFAQRLGQALERA